jgi:cob(I)alamin adenosyltransferase
VCRRAERRLVSLAADDGAGVSSLTVVYLNRLSDLLFVLARSINADAGTGDVPWQRSE